MIGFELWIFYCCFPKGSTWRLSLENMSCLNSGPSSAMVLITGRSRTGEGRRKPVSWSTSWICLFKLTVALRSITTQTALPAPCFLFQAHMYFWPLPASQRKQCAVIQLLFSCERRYRRRRGEKWVQAYHFRVERGKTKSRTPGCCKYVACSDTFMCEQASQTSYYTLMNCISCSSRSCMLLSYPACEVNHISLGYLQHVSKVVKGWS